MPLNALLRDAGLVETRREAQRIVSCLLGVALDYSFDPAAQAQPRLRAVMVDRVLKGPLT